MHLVSLHSMEPYYSGKAGFGLHDSGQAKEPLSYYSFLIFFLIFGYIIFLWGFGVLGFWGFGDGSYSIRYWILCNKTLQVSIR